ncbi:MAG: HD domain-containing protein [bacterium]|nr:HD domain-containing protein [bacterium]
MQVQVERAAEALHEDHGSAAAAGDALVRFLPPYSGTAADGSEQVFDPRGVIDLPMRTYQGIVDMLQDVMVRAASGEPIAVDKARGFVETVLNRLDVDPATMMSLGRYERYDAFTFGHSIRVAFLALNFARTFVTDEELLHRIGIAAMLHDVGKAWVPFEVLHSTGRLSDEERQQMNRHTEYGGQILLELAGGDPMVVAAAFGHHRTGDGGGYPKTIHEAELSTCTRVVKICDVYEALTAVRPYKDRMSPLRAYRVMMSMKGHFDPFLLWHFIQRNGLYPDGSRVRLSTGDEASVVAQGNRVDRPLVLVDGAGEEEAIDLSTDPAGAVTVDELVAQRSAA